MASFTNRRKVLSVGVNVRVIRQTENGKKER
jgi:hypothetical protein